MATDVDVQYFSHLNGLTLDNNWGDLIRLLDTCLVNGLALTSITSASIDPQGDITLNLYAAHNCMLFQIVELYDFADVSVDGVSRQINGKYRIKGVPSNNQLILKGVVRTVENPLVVNISSLGSAKLASLGYDIIFRDTNDVKRVYRSKNPTAQHPFIRVDESLTSADGTTGVYASTYAKYAMVGLLESMDHIDDYSRSDVLQLPFIPTAPDYTWRITGTGTAVSRGWSRWYWARNVDMTTSSGNGDTGAPATGSRRFTLVGDKDAFYFIRSHLPTSAMKTVSGCGLFDNAIPNDVIPNWFLGTCLGANTATATPVFYSRDGATPINNGAEVNAPTTPCAVFVPKYDPTSKLSVHVVAHGIAPNYKSGVSTALYDGSVGGVPALTIPIYAATDKILLGTLKHMCYAGANLSTLYNTTPKLSGNSMYVAECSLAGSANGGFYYYLGELE